MIDRISNGRENGSERASKRKLRKFIRKSKTNIIRPHASAGLHQEKIMNIELDEGPGN